METWRETENENNKIAFVETENFAGRDIYHSHCVRISIQNRQINWNIREGSFLIYIFFSIEENGRAFLILSHHFSSVFHRQSKGVT